jgi:hypothetical protein
MSKRDDSQFLSLAAALLNLQLVYDLDYALLSLGDILGRLADIVRSDCAGECDGSIFIHNVDGRTIRAWIVLQGGDHTLHQI